MEAALRRLRELSGAAGGEGGAAARAKRAGRLRLVAERLSECAPLGIEDETLCDMVDAVAELNALPAQLALIGRRLIPITRLPRRAARATMRRVMRDHALPDHTTRITFALDWLRALLEHDLIDLEDLDIYYEFFFYLLNFKTFRVYAARFVQRLTKQSDVTRARVAHVSKLIHTSRSSQGCKSLYAVLEVFKAYRPEMVLEPLPSVDVDSAFPKIHQEMLENLKLAQCRRTEELANINKHKIKWKQSAKSLVSSIPSVEYLRLETSKLYDGKKTCLEFQNLEDLMSQDLQNSIETPSRIISLLVNNAGLLLILFSDDHSKSRFSHSLYQILYNEYILETSSMSVREKRAFLKRLVSLQKYILQGIPVISRFLALYVSTWNGCDFFSEIFSLLEWTTFDSFEDLYDCILSHIQTLYFTNNPFYGCTIINMLKRLYINIFNRMQTEKQPLFISREKKYDDISVLNGLSEFINELCEKSAFDIVQNTTLRNTYLDTYSTIANLQLDCRQPLWTVTPMSLTYGVLSTLSAHSIDTILGIFLRYHRIYEKIKASHGRDVIRAQIMTVQSYTEDYTNCLWFGDSFGERERGCLFGPLSDEGVLVLRARLEKCGVLLHLCYHGAFAPYTYTRVPVEHALKVFRDRGGLSALPFSNVARFIESYLAS